jgi:nucleoside-diphosphate-sugar epimerase
MRILVIGGSGVVGRPTAGALARRGHDVAVLTRRGTGAPPGTRAYAGELTTGAGLAEALEGVAAVVDASNSSR